MLIKLLSHQWKSFVRRSGFNRSIIINVVHWLVLIYLLVTALIFGLLLNDILIRVFPGQDPVKSCFKFILYYLLFDLLVRFMMQELPVLTVQPYLIKKIRRKTLINFLNLRSLFTIFNVIPLLLFIPFAVKSIALNYGAFHALLFIGNVIAFCLFNHFFILYVKRRVIINNWMLPCFLLVIVILFATDYFGILQLREISKVIFSAFLAYSWLIVISWLLAITAYYINYYFLNKSLYLEDNRRSSQLYATIEYDWLRKFGITGSLITVDLKLITRNKRPRILILVSLIFLFYGFLFFTKKNVQENHFDFILLGAFIVTGFFVINYGQFLFAWQSCHFDKIVTSKISVEEYIRSKFYVMIMFSTVAFFITLFYGFVSWRIMIIELAAFLFNIGFNTALVGLFATRNYKGLNINSSMIFNYEGMGGTQWLYTLTAILFLIAIYYPLALLFNPWSGILGIGSIGIISLTMQNIWVNIIAERFRNNKYKILDGFKQR